MDMRRFDTVVKSEQGAVLELRDPATGDVILENGKPITVTLAGPDSERCRNQTNATVDRRLQVMAKTGREKPTAEEQDGYDVDMLVALTMAWEGIGLDDAPVLECTPANVRRFFGEFPAFRRQALRFADSYANFTMGSPKS